MPQRIRYGKDFLICGPNGTRAKNPALIRPGMPTHGYDQNQRYVPLTIVDTVASAPGSQLWVRAPADSFEAPPGDYLLFILNASGVPAVAHWVRVGSEWNEGDNVRPRPNPVGADLVSGSDVLVTWIAPGDDSLTGHAWQYDLRHRNLPIHAGNLDSATVVTTVPPPAVGGTAQSVVVSGPGCNWHYYAMRTVDESGNYSAWHFTGPIRPVGCGGGGCGTCEARAGEARTESRRSGPRGGERAQHDEMSAVLTEEGNLLVAEFNGDAVQPVWRLSQAPRQGLEGLTPSDTAGVLIQSFDPGSGWWTRARAPSMTGPIGVRSLVQPGRVVFLGRVSLGRIQDLPPGFSLESAGNSRTGPVEFGSADGAGVMAELRSGDTLTLVFRASQHEAAETAEDCFFVVGVPGATTPSEGTSSRALTGLRFALHPNRPNPFGSGTTIAFALPHEARVRLDIFDMQGRRVRVLADGAFTAGEHEVQWDRRTTSGTIAQPGIYIYRIKAGDHRARRKMVVLP